VIGCGPVGLAVIAGLKLKDWHPIVAAIIRRRARTGAAARADIVVDPRRSSPMRPGRAQPRCRRSKRRARRPLQALLPRAQARADFRSVGIPGLLQQVFEGAPRDARIVWSASHGTDRSEPCSAS